MDAGSTTEQLGSKNIHKNKIHGILAHSYILYFIFFLFGILLDFIFPVKIFGNYIISIIGTIFLILGTILIIWAQKSSHRLKKENINKETFYQGPYRYTRSPTHLGLLLLTVGFGIIANTLFIVISSIISFIVTKFIFIKAQEKVLAEKYGTPYLEYKESVKF
jgi:protein-S-isoprenylcysteine O-methyltransferase Ste14